MAMTGLKVSKNIEQFLNFYNEANSRYTYAYDMVNQCDKLKCDLLHKLELGQFSDRNEKRRIHTKLEQCLKDRRYYKDIVEELSPFILLFNDPDKSKVIINRTCKQTIQYMTQSLGSVRKAENYHTCRTYKPRIMKDTYWD